MVSLQVISFENVALLNERVIDINKSVNESWIKDDFIRYYNLVTVMFLFVLMILCFILNLISIFCISCSKTITPIKMLILNLAVSDIFYASCIPMFAKQFSGGTVYQTEFGCRISFFLDVTCMIVGSNSKL